MKSPLAVVAPSSHDPAKGSTKVKVAGVGAAIVVLLEQFTDLPHDTIIALAQILAVVLGGIGLVDTATAWSNGKKNGGS